MALSPPIEEEDERLKARKGSVYPPPLSHRRTAHRSRHNTYEYVGGQDGRTQQPMRVYPPDLETTKTRQILSASSSLLQLLLCSLPPPPPPPLKPPTQNIDPSPHPPPAHPYPTQPPPNYSAAGSSAAGAASSPPAPPASFPSSKESLMARASLVGAALSVRARRVEGCLSAKASFVYSSSLLGSFEIWDCGV